MIKENIISKMSDEELKNYLNGSLLNELDFETVVKKANKSFEDKVLYSGLSHNYKINKNTKEETLNYKKKIGLSLYNEIKEMLTRRGQRLLLIAPAGGGKTYTMLQISSDLVEENGNVVYILSVPNTSQSNQNQVSEDLEKFGFISEVGKKSKLESNKDNDMVEMLKSGHRKFSCVYDKTLELVNAAKKLNLEVVLVVDEAHKLIYDTYRETSIAEMDMAIAISDMVISMTATADICQYYYKYDYIYRLRDLEQQNNIKNFRIIYSNNWEITLRKELRKLKKEGKVALVKSSYSLDKMQSMKEALEKQGYIVEILSSRTKNEYAFKMIEELGMISADVNVVLTTSVVEAGISLKDTDIVPIEIIRGSRDFVMDNTIQFFARPRKKVSTGIMIVKNYSDDIAKELLEYEEELNKNKNAKLKKPVSKIDNCINQAKTEAHKTFSTTKSDIDKMLNKEYRQTIIEYAQTELKTGRSRAIEFDTESLELYVNTKTILKEAFAYRDNRIINSNPLALLKVFEGQIFYDEITAELDLGGVVNEEDFESIKEEKEKRKELQELKDLKELEYRKWFEDKNFLKALESIVNNEINRANIKNYNLSMSLRDIIEFKNSSLYKVVLDLIKHFTVSEISKIITAKYQVSGEYVTKSDIKDICKRKHIVDKIKNGYYEGVETEYNLICTIIQDAKTKNKTQAPKQINLTDDMIVVLLSELNRNNCKGYRTKELKDRLKKLTKSYKGKIDYKTFYTDKIIKELKTAISNSSGDIRTSLKNKIVNEIGKIYGIGIQEKLGKEYLIVNNPHKTFKLDTTLENITSKK